MSTHPLETTTETVERESVRVVSFANETYEDPKYGTLRTTSITGGWDVTPEGIGHARRATPRSA